MDMLKPGQKNYLIEVAQSSEVVSELEERVKKSCKTFNWWILLALVIIITLLGLLAVLGAMFYSEGNVDMAIITSLGICISIFLFIYCIRRFTSVPVAFGDLVSTMSKIDEAMGSQTASKSRRDAAKRLTLCARRMRNYRPLIPLRADKRTLAHEATRASLALRQSINTLILGTDEDLKQVKETLARAAIRVGTNNWVQVGDLGSPSNNSPTQIGTPIRQAEKKSGWERTGVAVQAVGALAIFVSLAGLLIGVQQFNRQQKTNAAQLLNQEYQATLDQYLNDMSDLVLTHHLADPTSSAPVRAIAVARTLTAVRNLDGQRKGTLLRFLWEADLINWPHPIVNLLHSDFGGTSFPNPPTLNQVYLSQLSLTNADFAGAYLLGAYLQGSVLIQANFSNAHLACSNQNVCANLSGAYLMRADLTGADLSGANLTGAYLEGADLSNANLTGVELQKAMYNVKPIQVINAQGEPVIDMPTRWPKGFDPEAAGATCNNYC